MLNINKVTEQRRFVRDKELDNHDGKAWYIPHHWLYCSQKNKLRFVFACEAPFQGTSLGNSSF